MSSVEIFTFHLMRLSIYREGDLSLIQADAITNTTDETLTERNVISNRIFRRAGPGLREEIANESRGKKVFTHTFRLYILNTIY